MKISLIAAMGQNRVIGNGPEIPWYAKGEQLMYKALTYQQYVLVGRKTFDTLPPIALKNRTYVVLSRGLPNTTSENVIWLKSVDDVLRKIPQHTDHLFVAGGGEIYAQFIHMATWIHLTTVHVKPEGNITFPLPPSGEYAEYFSQKFSSNIDYTYRILGKNLYR